MTDLNFVTYDMLVKQLPYLPRTLVGSTSSITAGSLGLAISMVTGPYGWRPRYWPGLMPVRAITVKR